MTPLLPPEVLFADGYNQPVFQMGPFDAAALARNFEIARAGGEASPPDWPRWFGEGEHFTLTVNGREAIDLALEDVPLAPDDEVLIVTTSGGPYISRCVTDSIEKRCRWSRELGPKTRAVFVIHEFGFPARLPEDVASAGLPIIEDCAYALGTSAPEGPVGRLGDYVIFSFSKALPMPYGGLLRASRPPPRRSRMSAQAGRETPVVAAHYLERAEEAFARRREVFELYRARFAGDGLKPLFEPAAGTVPHSFIVALEDQAKAEAMRPRLHAAGIISSVYFGGGGYFLPNHQGLTEAAVDYIAAHFMKALREA